MHRSRNLSNSLGSPGWALGAWNPWGSLGCRTETVHLVERQTGGKTGAVARS